MSIKPARGVIALPDAAASTSVRGTKAGGEHGEQPSGAVGGLLPITPDTMATPVRLYGKRLSGGQLSLFLFIHLGGSTRRKEFLKLYVPESPSGRAERQATADTLRRAEALRAQREKEVSLSPHGLEHEVKREGCFLVYFTAIAESRPRQHNSWLSALGYLRAFHGQGRLPFKEISPGWLNRYRAYLLEQPRLGVNSAKLYYRHVNTALERAFREGILVSNPFRRAEPIRGEETELTFLTAAELQAIAHARPAGRGRLAEVAFERVRRAFLFACYTGLRLSDVLALSWENVDLARKELAIWPKKTRRTTGQRLYVGLSDTALHLLGSPPVEGAKSRVFDLPDATNVQRAMPGLAKAAGIKRRISFHTARHTAATLMLGYGEGIATVSKVLGHASLTQTQRYAKVTDEARRKALSSIPALKL